jgi:peptidoglycan hydrolase-like protein with peptidoglycan-binding domain
MSPRHARIAVCAFCLLSLGVMINVLFLQTNLSTRTKLDQAQQKALGERARRLAADPAAEVSAKADPALLKAPAQIISGPAVVAEGLKAPLVQGAADAPEMVAAIQRDLQARGYEPGQPDGVAGAVTRAAIMAWEHDHGLMLTGEPTEAVKFAIQQGIAATTQAQISAHWQSLPKDKRARGEQLVRTVQQSLSALGYNCGRVTGRINEDTERSIREFEIDQNLKQSGRISAPLVARLTKLAGIPRGLSQGQPPSPASR